MVDRLEGVLLNELRKIGIYWTEIIKVKNLKGKQIFDEDKKENKLSELKYKTDLFITLIILLTFLHKKRWVKRVFTFFSLPFSDFQHNLFVNKTEP